MIAEIINKAIDNAEDESKLDGLVKEVKELCSGFPLYQNII